MNDVPEKEVEKSRESIVDDVSSDKESRDVADMARMGKKQEFKRNFNWISSVGFTSCTMGT